MSDANWHTTDFVARPLSQRWTGKLQPLLAINSSRLLLAAGNVVYSYGFGRSSTHTQAPPIFSECTYTTSALHPSRDITGLATVPNEDDRTLFMGYADGSIERVELPTCKPTSSTVDAALVERYNFHEDSLIESISLSSTHMLSLSSSGLAALLPLSTTDPTPEVIDLGVRSWVGYLSARSSSFAAFGSTSKLPLSVHPITSSHLSPHPSLFLAPHTSRTDRGTAVYSIQSAPLAAPWGDSDQIVVSGWYDGVVRVHDLRSSTRTTIDPFVSAHPSAAAPPSALAPVLLVSDPWSFEPIYSVACGGGSAAHIAAGSARHSVVSFWDVRAPARGWSVHAPGNDASPVYSLVVDGARVHGANESRGFVFDFGMGACEEAYPPIVPDALPVGRRRGRAVALEDNMKRTEKGGVGVYVTKYTHYK